MTHFMLHCPVVQEQVPVMKEEVPRDEEMEKGVGESQTRLFFSFFFKPSLIHSPTR